MITSEVSGYLYSTPKGQLQGITKITLVVFALVIFAFFYGLVNATTVRNSVHWKFWLQVATSNWSPEQPKQGDEKKEGQKDEFIGDVEYIAGVVLALVVNLGSFVLVFGTLWGVWMAEQRRIVNASKAYQYRDLGIQTALYWYVLNNFAPNLKETPNKTEREKIRNSISDIFNNANEDLPEDLKAGFGKAGEEFVERHKDDLIAPQSDPPSGSAPR